MAKKKPDETTTASDEPVKAKDFEVTDETTDQAQTLEGAGAETDPPAGEPNLGDAETADAAAERREQVDQALNAAIHGIIGYARNMPPAKPIEIGDIDAMRSIARSHLQHLLD